MTNWSFGLACKVGEDARPAPPDQIMTGAAPRDISTRRRPVIRRSAILTAAAFMAVFSLSRAQAEAAAPAELSRRLQAVLSGPDRDRGVVGEALAVIGPKARWTWSGAVGEARRGGEPMDARHAFRIASVTKPYVAASILRLMEDGRIDIDGPIRPLLSEETARLLVDAGYDPTAITVRQLLAHTSGMYDHAMDKRYAEAVLSNPRHRWTRAEQIGLLGQYSKPLGKPGERFSYSDTGYVILGEIVERLTGMPIGPAARKLIGFDRLGLTQTWWEDMEPAPAHVRIAHVYYGDLDGMDLDPSEDLYGGGGVVSTVGDLAKFYRALVRGDVFHDRRTLAVMMSVAPTETPPGRIDNNAVHAIVVGRHICWGHTGFWGGVGAYCPTLDLAFAWTQNQGMESGSGLKAFFRRLGEALDAADPEAPAGPAPR